MNDDRITHAQLSRLTGTRDEHTGPPVHELHTDFTCVYEVDCVCGRFQRGDRVALEHTDDPHTRLRPGDEGIVIRYDPEPGQFSDCSSPFDASELRFYVDDMPVTLSSRRGGRMI